VQASAAQFKKKLKKIVAKTFRWQENPHTSQSLSLFTIKSHNGDAFENASLQAILHDLPFVFFFLPTENTFKNTRLQAIPIALPFIFFMRFLAFPRALPFLPSPPTPPPPPPLIVSLSV
jgi:hypothetical protein